MGWKRSLGGLTIPPRFFSSFRSLTGEGEGVMNFNGWIWFSVLFFFASPAFGSEEWVVPCEILESSEALSSTSRKIDGLRYLLLHQANSADRDAFSSWLKAHSGTEIHFTFEDRTYQGVLCRLAHCFGRGLLIFTEDTQFKKRDIIDIVLPR